MKRWWTAQAVRIDGLSLRERVFLFLSLVAVIIVLVDYVWLAPARASHLQLSQAVARQGGELQRVRAEVQEGTRPSAALNQLPQELSQLGARQSDVNQRIQALLPSAKGSTPLAQALVHVLHRHQGLSLVRTTALAPDSTVPTATTATAPTVGTGLPGLSKQGVELAVAGPYPELIRYVQKLEQAMPNARWGQMTIKSDTQPPELTLQIFLLEMQP